MSLPTNQFVAYQSNLTLYVSANVTGQTYGFPISYQRQHDGFDIPGATSSSRVFAVLSSGTYSVAVWSTAGSPPTANSKWQISDGRWWEEKGGKEKGNSRKQ